MNYDAKEADRYYVVSGVLRDMGFRGAGDYWYDSEGFGPYGFDFLASAPAVRHWLRQEAAELTIKRVFVSREEEGEISRIIEGIHSRFGEAKIEMNTDDNPYGDMGRVMSSNYRARSVDVWPREEDA